MDLGKMVGLWPDYLQSIIEMTQIKFIRGIPRPTDRFRLDDSPKASHRSTYKNWQVKSEGEFALQLILDRLLIEKNYYGDPQGLYQVAENMIYNAVSAGLHTANGIASFGPLPDELMGVARDIKRARRLTKNAAFRIAGPFDPYSNDPIVSDTTCVSIRARLDELIFQVTPVTPPNSALRREIAQLQKELAICVDRVDHAKLLNENLEGASPDYAYAYFTSQEINQGKVARVVEGKSISQGIALERISSITKVSKNNLRIWTENGIMRQNVNNGTQPFLGRETAYAVGYAHQANNPNIGFLDGASLIAVITLATTIITAVAQAVTASRNMFDAFKREERAIIESSIKRPGTQGFSPLEDDWFGYILPTVDENGNPVNPGDSGGNGGLIPSNNSGLIIGAGVALFGSLLLNNNNTNK